MALAFLIDGTSKKSRRYRQMRGNVSPIYLFIAALIPDLDFVFYDIIGHHTITHSLTFWSWVFLPLFVRWRTKIIPYYLATLSHLLGDYILGKPPLLLGIWDQQYGLIYDYATTTLDSDQFMLLRSLFDLSVVISLLILRKKDRSTNSLFSADRDVVVALPILIILVISIFIGSLMQDEVFLFDRDHDWPVYFAAYSILIIFHILILLVIMRESVRFVKTRQTGPIRRL